MSAIRRSARARGFTLIEILVAVTLLVIVLGIVYGAYSSVVLSVERTRDASERLKTMQFLVRGFTQNLAQATEGWSPGSAYRPYSAGGVGGGGQDTANAATGVAMRFPFMGEIKETADGTVDSLSFGSTAPLLGGGQLPGQLKMCTYRLEKEKSDEDDDPKSEKKLSKEEQAEADARWLLVLTETPWTPVAETTDTGLATAEEVNKRIGEAAEEIGQKPVTRSTVIYGWDIAYFDGKEWVEEWHSDDVGYLPWSVRMRVKLEREPGEEPVNKLDPEKDPTVIELLFSVPAGAGIHDGPPDYVRPTEREDLP